MLQAQLYTINYSSQDGLPNDYITCMNEDSHGYIWVGTASGLVQFDGVNFLRKGWQGSGDIPKDVFVKEILFDSNQNLWISTERNGIFHQDLSSMIWTNFSNHKIDDRQISADEIDDIELYDEKLFFSCYSCGIAFIDIHNLTSSVIPVLDKSRVIKYCSDTLNNKLIVGTRSSVFDISQDSDSYTIDTLLYYYSDLDLSDIDLDSEGQIWVTDYSKGIFLYDKATLKLLDKNPGSFGDKWKYIHLFTSNNEEWLLMPSLGIAHKKTRNETWDLHTPLPFDLHSLPKATFTNIFEDKKGGIWVSSSKGLSCIHPDYQGFKHILNNTTHTDYLLDAEYDESLSRYVLSYASPESRVKIFDKDFNLLSYLNQAVEDKRMLSIFELIPFTDGYLGLGNFIYFIDPKNQTIAKANLPGLPSNLSPKSALIDNNDLWIFTSENTLIQYAIAQKKVLREINIPLFKEKPYPFYLVHHLEDFGGYIGISAQSVFALISKSNGRIHYYDIDLNSLHINKLDDHPHKSGTITQSVYLGNGDFYLVSKSEGLHKAHLDESTLEISISHTLSPDLLYSPVELVLDQNQNVWIATDNGLALATNDLHVLKKITSTQGLKNSKLVQGLSMTNGQIILNGESGIIVGDTSVLAKKNEPIHVDIAEATLSGVNLLHCCKTAFNYTQNNLQIRVSTPLYTNRESYKYAYRLANHSDEWTYQDVKFDAIHYENLPPGSYTFMIKSVISNKEGQITRLPFKIHPPFWKTWWFFCLCLFSLSALLYLFYKNRLKSKLDNERLNTQLAELKNEAIRAQLNPHFIFNALNSIRSMILLDKKEESIEYLGHFSSMVRDILTLSKEKSIPLSKEIEFNERYIKIEQLRFSQQFSYHIHIESGIDPMRILVPPLLLQPFIENAIWHGLLHKEGQAILKVDISNSDNMLFIKIDDNGIGRKASQKLKSGLRTKTRKGYGEILSAQRIHILGEKAEIRIEDKMENEIPKGTLVTIKIPLKYE